MCGRQNVRGASKGWVRGRRIKQGGKSGGKVESREAAGENILMQQEHTNTGCRQGSPSLSQGNFDTKAFREAPAKESRFTIGRE